MGQAWQASSGNEDSGAGWAPPLRRSPSVCSSLRRRTWREETGPGVPGFGPPPAQRPRLGAPRTTASGLAAPNPQCNPPIRQDETLTEKTQNSGHGAANALVPAPDRGEKKKKKKKKKWW